MDGLIRLFAAGRETIEKRAMGFHMSDWDQRLLRFNELFERRLMDLSVNIPLESALDTGWQILASCFRPAEVGLRSQLIDRFWPADAVRLDHRGDEQKASGTARTITDGAMGHRSTRAPLPELEADARSVAVGETNDAEA